MFIIALFTIVKTWKEPKCPTDDWITLRCGIYIRVCVCVYIYLSIYIDIYTHTHIQYA